MWILDFERSQKMYEYLKRLINFSGKKCSWKCSYFEHCNYGSDHCRIFGHYIGDHDRCKICIEMFGK